MTYLEQEVFRNYLICRNMKSRRRYCYRRYSASLRAVAAHN